MRTFLAILFLAVVGLVAGNYFVNASGKVQDFYTTPITRGNITEAVAVTGYAEPVEFRVVQSEVPGIVEDVLVDYNEEVKSGQELARLSADLQRVQLEKAEADREKALSAIKISSARIDQARSGLMAAESALAAAEREYNTAKQNAAKQLLPQSKVDTLEDLVQKAKAGVANSQSEIKQAEAAKATMESDLKAATVAIKLANLSLDKTVLRSNMDGIVLDKSLRVGDMVGQPRISLTDPSPALFKIAAPLNKMQGIVKVSEADYSRVKVGQIAKFTIDAYPDEMFDATVTQVRDAPNSDMTAVSYATVLEFDNRVDPQTGGWMVKPRSTISADIEVRKAQDVLLISNAALLFSPTHSTATIPSVSDGERIVWTIGSDKEPLPRIITTGITDGLNTEITGGELKEGELVITGEPVSGSQAGFRLPFSN